MTAPPRPEPIPAGLAPELAEALPAFELFFKTFGFKRIHGRVWGLLVLYGRPLSNRDICHLLSISMGAASTTLNQLEEWGALTTEFDSARRCHLHAPVGNALSIVATVFRRREQVAFQSFRQAAQRAVEYIQRQHGDRDPRVYTLRSIIAACGLADAMMNIIFSAVTNALGDSESMLSRALASAFKAGVGGPARLLFRGPNAARARESSSAAAAATEHATEHATGLAAGHATIDDARDEHAAALASTPLAATGTDESARAVEHGDSRELESASAVTSTRTRAPRRAPRAPSTSNGHKQAHA